MDMSHNIMKIVTVLLAITKADQALLVKVTQNNGIRFCTKKKSSLGRYLLSLFLYSCAWTWDCCFAQNEGCIFHTPLLTNLIFHKKTYNINKNKKTNVMNCSQGPETWSCLFYLKKTPQINNMIK